MMIVNFKKYSLLVLFTLFIGLLTLFDLISPTQDYSELENRNLATRPTLTTKSFFENRFGPSYEKFINDQFIGRNDWINLKSRGEYVLGKIENNGVIYGEDHHLFEKLQKYNETTLTNNINAITHFAEQYNLKTSFVLIPNSYAILDEKLPQGAYMLDQPALMHQIYEKLPSQIQTLDLFPTLKAHKEDYIYYLTDHHWTTYGAYLAYSGWVESLGMAPISLDQLNAIEVPDFYGTYFSKTKSFNAVSDTITYYPIEASLTIDGIPKESLYDDSKWATRDKYAAFLWGNNGVSVIKSTHNLYTTPDKVSKLIVFKDSYANALVPFLTYHFDEIHVIDLRALPMKLSDYMATEQFDQALILYNITNFIQDTNISRFKQ